MPASPGDPRITAVVVLYNSAAVIQDCLRSLLLAAPRRSLQLIVVDNASTDDGAARAAALAGEQALVRLPGNRGFAAGVNAGLARANAPLLAVVNPDLRLCSGALDRLADVLESDPGTALVGPRVDDSSGRREPTAGVFPTPERERAHAFMLDRLFGVPGRGRPQPDRDARVDWVSGCAWLLRREAWEACGPLDEEYFMYSEDVDYCRRLASAGWATRFVAEARAQHDCGAGSVGSAQLPADGGRALLHYLVKFCPGVPRESLRGTLLGGWRLRYALHTIRATFGNARSAALARRYARAIESLREVA